MKSSRHGFYSEENRGFSVVEKVQHQCTAPLIKYYKNKIQGKNQSIIS